MKLTSGSTTRFDIGSFVNVENVHGTPDINFVSGEIENYKTLRLVDTAHATRGTVFGTALAHVFDIGRAKTRAFEYNSGNAVSTDSGTTTLLSTEATTDVKFKHFLFDIEMFSHVNVAGAMSGALQLVINLLEALQVQLVLLKVFQLLVQELLQVQHKQILL